MNKFFPCHKGIKGNGENFMKGDIFKKEDRMREKFEPVILGFLCNWCAYAGGDLAGVGRMQYPPNMRAVRVMCSGMVHPDLVLEAFKRGADGVIMMG
jgi:F420-non-reducing hydrogenase iron-sulfur subunit